MIVKELYMQVEIQVCLILMQNIMKLGLFLPYGIVWFVYLQAGARTGAWVSGCGIAAPVPLRASLFSSHLPELPFVGFQPKSLPHNSISWH